MRIDWQQQEAPFSRSWIAAYSGVIESYNSVHVALALANGIVCMTISTGGPSVLILAAVPSIEITGGRPEITVTGETC